MNSGSAQILRNDPKSARLAKDTPDRRCSAPADGEPRNRRILTGEDPKSAFPGAAVPQLGHTCGRCADLGVHPRRPETHRDLRACTSELHRSREALSRARGRAPIWGRPQRSTETAPIWGHTCWNPPIWGVAPIWGHSSESAPIWEKSHHVVNETEKSLFPLLFLERSARRGPIAIAP